MLDLSKTIKLDSSITASLKDTLAVLNKTYAETFKPISDAFKEINIQLEATFKPVREIFKKNKKSFMRFDALRKLGKAQFVFCDFLPDGLVESIVSSKNIENTILNMIDNNQEILDANIRALKNHKGLLPYELLCRQSFTVFENGSYDLAVVGFLSIIDGLLTDTSKSSTHKPTPRIEIILSKLDSYKECDKYGFSVGALYFSFSAAADVLFKYIPFTEKEPMNLNRHWIMHGRSKREKTRLDCIKLITFMHGILLMSE